jgi:hypothetical protein
MKTAFLDWLDLGNGYWSSKDPVDPNRRWIIRRCTHGAMYELVWVKHSSEAFVQRSNSVEFLGWFAVTTRICQMAEMVYVNKFIIDKKHIEQMREFLESLSNDTNKPVDNGNTIGIPSN